MGKNDLREILAFAEITQVTLRILRFPRAAYVISSGRRACLMNKITETKRLLSHKTKLNNMSAAKVIESWKLITAIDNYEEVAGVLLFRR